MKTTANLKNYIQSKHDENDSIANELNNSYYLELFENTEARLLKIDKFNANVDLIKELEELIED